MTFSGRSLRGVSASRHRRLSLFSTFSIGVVALDQVTKWGVLRYIGPDRVVKIAGPIVLRRAFNTGVAFTLGSSQRWLPYVLPLVVVVLTIWALRRLDSPRLGSDALESHAVESQPADPLVLALLVGGAWGNLLDRCFRGESFLTGAVVDFIDVGVFDFPVFNIADSALTVGCALLMILALLQNRARRRIRPTFDGRPEQRHAAANEGNTP